jgi:hypothetical protein
MSTYRDIAMLPGLMMRKKRQDALTDLSSLVEDPNVEGGEGEVDIPQRSDRLRICSVTGQLSHRLADRLARIAVTIIDTKMGPNKSVRESLTV